MRFGSRDLQLIAISRSALPHTFFFVSYLNLRLVRVVKAAAVEHFTAVGISNHDLHYVCLVFLVFIFSLVVVRA